MVGFGGATTLAESAILARPAVWSAGCLDRPAFDIMLVVGTAAVALAGGITAWIVPAMFLPILIADFWILGYHHVVSTYTRLAFDRASRREHFFLVYVLPLLVLAAVLLMIVTLGMWSVPTLYLYWQWFHYTRQSYGIAQIYRRKAGVLGDEPRWLQQATIYALPLWGILHRSAAGPERFLGLEIAALPVPVWLADGVGIAALALTGAWIASRIRDFWNGRLALLHTVYLASHFVIFFAGYVAIPSMESGWLVINIWHNAQYVLFVWLYNRNRFRKGMDPAARVLSWTLQPGRAWAYFGMCLAISTTLYVTANQIVGTFAAIALPLMLIIFQTINFHHYIVDALIWKVRKPPLRATLGING